MCGSTGGCVGKQEGDLPVCVCVCDMWPGTSVTNAIECTRKAWLNELLVGSSNTASLLGTLMHEVLQKTLTAAMNGPVTHQHTENLVS